MGNRAEAPDCLVEQAVNAALDQAFHDAEALLLSRLGEVTLAMLSADFIRVSWRAAMPIVWRSSMHPEVTRPDATSSDVTHADAGAQALLAPFSDPDAVARYAEGPARFVPGFARFTA